MREQYCYSAWIVEMWMWIQTDTLDPCSRSCFQFFFSTCFCFLRQLSLFTHCSSTIHTLFTHTVCEQCCYSAWIVEMWMWIQTDTLDPRSCSRFQFFFFFSTRFLLFETIITTHYSSTVHTLFTHCSWNLQPLYSGKKIKNGSHGTIYTFKNYFAIVFLVFNFSKNKLYSNGP